MKNLFVLLPLAIFSLMLASCEKEPVEHTQPESVLKYYPLSIGNYWVYQNYKIDSLGNEEVFPWTDSIVIEQDSMINGNTYYVLINYPNGRTASNQIQGILRDSATYIVDQNGNRIISTSDFGSVLRTRIIAFEGDTLVKSEYLMDSLKTSQTVPAGNFDALDRIANHYLYYYQNNELTDQKEVALKDYYGYGIGPVSLSYTYVDNYFRTKETYERRLTKYHINN